MSCSRYKLRATTLPAMPAPIIAIFMRIASPVGVMAVSSVGEPRQEGIGTGNVFTIPRPTFRNVALKQCDSGNPEQQRGHCNWREHHPPRTARKRDQIQSPGDTEFAKIVWVAGITP